MSPVPADDPALALAIDFLNTYDALETPPDRLSVDLVRRLVSKHGFAASVRPATNQPSADAGRGIPHESATGGRIADADIGVTLAGEEFTAADLEPLRRLREKLRPVFADPDPANKINVLDEVFRAEAAGVRVVAEAGRITLRAAGGNGPVGRFAVLITDALAQALAAGGPSRFGTCAADPCRCVYVDRTRSARQRYCCELCNDRMAAAAYRRRSEGQG